MALHFYIALIFALQMSCERVKGAEKPRRRMPWNITDIITEGYDARLRPNFGMEGQPVSVEVDILVASVDRISEVNMDYTLTIYLKQYWKDTRLAYKYFLDERVKELPVDGRITDKLWLPDTYFTNDKDSYLQDITVKNRMLRIGPNGDIIYGLRLSVTASCVFELKKFPHDEQNCSLNLESYGYSTNDIRLKWSSPCVEGFEEVELPQFRVIEWDCRNSTVVFTSGAYDRLLLGFVLKRSVGYFVFQTYMPCIMVVCMSWVSFWINYESSPARVALGITTVLTMTTIFTSARASLPRFSYVKAIDIYLLTCFVFVFASLIEYAIVNYNFWKIKHKLNKQTKKSTTFPQIQHPVSSRNPEILTPDELIALRLSTPASEVNSNSPDLPRKLSPRTPTNPSMYNLERTYSTPGPTRFSRGFIQSYQGAASPDSFRGSLKFHPGMNGSVTNRRNPSFQQATAFQMNNNIHDSRQFQSGFGRKMSGSGGTEGTSQIYRHHTTYALEDSPGCGVRIRAMLRDLFDCLPTIDIPSGERVIIIDRYSRMLFPSAFILFNAIYWWHYVL